MSDINDLYQQLIIDHSKNPRNYGVLSEYTHQHEGNNPLCGDKVEIFLKIKNNVITEIAWQGQGCAISQASVSLMSEYVKGKTVAQAKEAFKNFQELVTNKDFDSSKAGKLKIFAGVRGFPARVKCASMGWHTLNSIIEK